MPSFMSKTFFRPSRVLSVPALLISLTCALQGHAADVQEYSVVKQQNFVQTGPSAVTPASVAPAEIIFSVVATDFISLNTASVQPPGSVAIPLPDLDFTFT